MISIGKFLLREAIEKNYEIFDILQNSGFKILGPTQKSFGPKNVAIFFWSKKIPDLTCPE